MVVFGNRLDLICGGSCS